MFCSTSVLLAPSLTNGRILIQRSVSRRSQPDGIAPRQSDLAHHTHGVRLFRQGLCVGGFYDNDGNPSGLTRERLNGLLAALGDASVIPPKVRVFIEHDYEMCYVGSGEQKVAFSKKTINIVSIDAVADFFVFEDMTPCQVTSD